MENSFQEIANKFEGDMKDCSLVFAKDCEEGGSIKDVEVEFIEGKISHGSPVIFYCVDFAEDGSNPLYEILSKVN